MEWAKLKRLFFALLTASCQLCSRVFDGRAKILRQEITSGKTTFILIEKHRLTRVSAQELYKNHLLLNIFSRKDLITIVSTAVQEQAMDDFLSVTKCLKMSSARVMDLADNLCGLDPGT